MTTSSTTKEDILNVGMDKYDLHTGRLASTGANTCVIILVLFINEEEIFIEHRISIPDNSDPNNMKKCLSSVYILGGNKNSPKYKTMQESIQSLMIQHDVNDTTRYTELIRNIKWVNVLFNLYTEEPQTTGECNISVIVDRNIRNTQIALVQRLSKLSGGLVDSLIGAMILDLVSHNSWFAIINNEPNNQGTAEEQKYHSDSITHFKTIMSDVNATELFDDDAKDLIKRVTDIEAEVQDESDDEATMFGLELYDS
ncbi:unnamed protein product [Rotaria socialis]